MKYLYFITLTFSLLVAPFLMKGQNNCLDFDGTDDYITVADNAAFDFTSFTVEAWVYPSALTGYHTIIGKSNEQWIPASSGFDLETTGTTLYGSVWDASGAQSYIQGGTLTTGIWQHIAMTWTSGGGLILYINGINVGSQPTTYTGSNANDGTLKIGVFPWVAQYFWNGQIDEVRIWNDVRTEAEIRQYMYRELPADIISGSDLVTYYKFNEISGTSLTDSKGSYTGTLTNMAGSEWQTSSAMFGPKNCLDFDGTDDYVTTGAGLVNFSNDLTIEAWFNTTNSNSFNSIATMERYNPNGGGNFFQLLTNSTGNIYLDDANDASIFTTTESYNDGNWHHVAFVRDATAKTIYLYADGVLKGSETYTSSGTIDPDHELRFGNSEYDGGSYQMDGMLDEIRIWNDVRTNEEIVENMCNTLTGNETGLVGYYTFDNPSGSDLQDFAYNDGSLDDGALTNMDNNDWVSSSAYNTWLNTSSTSWNTATNWSLGSAPNSSTVNVGIPNYGTSPSTSGDIEINNLVVCSGASLDLENGSSGHTIHGSVFNIGTTNIIANNNLTITGSLYMLSGSTLNINPRGALTVEKNLYNRTGLFGHATLNINSTPSGTGSLIIDGTLENDGSIYCQRYIDDWNTGDGWHFLSSPVDDQSISPGFVDISGTISSSVDFYKWSEPLDLWINIKKEDGAYNQGSEASNFSNEADPKFGVGLGYLVAYEDDVTKTFSGTLNNYSPSKPGLTYTSASTHTGAHLLGNPFPCALQWDHTTGESGWHLDNIDGTAKIWSSANSSYTDIAQNGIIPAMQGFMVIVSSEGTGSLNIFKGDRIHSSTSWYKETEINKVKLTVFDPVGGKAQESILMAKDNATSGFDHQYDSPFFSGYAPLFYSWIDQKPASTNAIPSFDNNLVIPFAFRKNESTDFYITIEGTENLIPEREVFLIDHKLDQTTNLSQQPTYFFSSFEGDDINRFSITFKAVGINDPEITPNAQLPIHCWNHEQTLTISNPQQLTGTIEVFNMTGQTMLSAKLQNVTKQTLMHALKPGLYVVRVNAENQTKCQKIMI